MVESKKEKENVIVSDDLSMVEYEKAKVKLMVSDEMVEYVLAKYEKNWNIKDEIDDVILEDLQIKYGKYDKGKGKVDDLQNRVERLEGDLARAEKEKAKMMVSKKGKAKQAEDDVDDVDLVDAFDLENIIKKLEEDFSRLLKAKKAKEAKESEEVELKVKNEEYEHWSKRQWIWTWKQANEGSQGQLWRNYPARVTPCPEHKLNEHEQLQIFYQGLNTKTRRKEGNIKVENEELQVVLSQIYNFENNMNIITEEVQMAQHRYETPMEGRILNLGETLNTFIKESPRRQKESENMVWGIKKSYNQTFKVQASSIKMIEYHLGKIAKLIQDREAGSLPSSTKTNPRGLVHAITTRSGLNYKPPKNPLENNTKDKPITNETITRNKEEVPDGHRNIMESCHMDLLASIY
ncbi:hypothetical protein Tco_1269201 [Tanacetum coccineum]